MPSTRPPMRPPSRVLRLLDAVLSILVVLQTTQTVLESDGASPWVVLAGATACLVMATSWVLWRVRGWRWPMVLLSLSSLVSVFAGGGGGAGTIAVVLGLAGVTYVYGLTAGTALVAGFVALDAGASVVRVAHRGSWVGSVVEVAGTFLVLMLGVVVGLVLRELSAERRRNAELVEQVRDAAVTEQELMLADERSRSARELHDGLGHQLTLVTLSLEYAERMRSTSPDKAFAEVGQAHDTAAAALEYLRRWVRALNPPRDPNVTGTAAFEAIADSFRGTGLDITVTHTGQERELGQAASLFALRMVQEGLTNVVRHSDASSVALHLDWTPTHLTLTVRDNGGAPDGVRPGFGLRSLAERAADLDGTFTVNPDADGVELVGMIPLGGTHGPDPAGR